MRAAFITASAALALLGAGCAAAPEPAAEMQLASAEAGTRRVSDPGWVNGDPKEIVCVREHVVGSNRPKRRCATRLEWRMWTQRSQDKLEKLEQTAKPAPQNGGPGGPI